MIEWMISQQQYMITKLLPSFCTAADAPVALLPAYCQTTIDDALAHLDKYLDHTICMIVSLAGQHPQHLQVGQVFNTEDDILVRNLRRGMFVEGTVFTGKTRQDQPIYWLVSRRRLLPVKDLAALPGIDWRRIAMMVGDRLRRHTIYQAYMRDMEIEAFEWENQEVAPVS